PFLLMATSFVSLAVIDKTLPAIGAPTVTQEEDDKEKLNLTIAITDEGYQIGGADAVLESTGEGDQPGYPDPCTRPGCPTPDTYDTKELTRLLGQVKDRFEDEENVILVPEVQIPYEVLVLTMDATREDLANTSGGEPRLLFPYVVIAGGT